MTLSVAFDLEALAATEPAPSEPAGDAATVTELRAQLSAMTGALARLTAVPAAEPLGASLLISDLWVRYRRTWEGENWAGSVRGLMKAPLDHFGTYRVGEITRAAWNHYRDEVRAKQTTMFGGPPSPHTQNMECKRFKALFNWAINEEIIAVNPLAAVKMLKEKRSRHTEPSQEGLAKILAQAEPLERAFVLLGFDCGMRATEIRTITWPQIDFARRRLVIFWHRTKTRQQRVVPLSDRAIAALGALPRIADDVFTNPKTGHAYSKANMFKRMRPLMDLIGSEADPSDGNVHFHDSRRAFMSGILRRGVRLPVAMKLTGHASLSAASVYINTSDQDIEDARAMLHPSDGGQP